MAQAVRPTSRSRSLMTDISCVVFMAATLGIGASRRRHRVGWSHLNPEFDYAIELGVLVSLNGSPAGSLTRAGCRATRVDRRGGRGRVDRVRRAGPLRVARARTGRVRASRAATPVPATGPDGCGAGGNSTAVLRAGDGRAGRAATYRGVRGLRPRPMEPR